MIDYLIFTLKCIGVLIAIYIIARVFAKGIIHELDDFLYKKFKSHIKTKEDGKKEN
jgi:hypothetical protein